MSIAKNETGSHRYPSITFCPMFREKAHITEHVLRDFDMSKSKL